MTGACPAWGWGRKALKAQPSSATRGRAQDRSASNGVASRFNVRSARNSFRRPQIHPRAVGKLTSVTICRELKHSDQTIKSEHVGTDRRRKNRLLFTSTPCARDHPRPGHHGGGVKLARYLVDNGGTIGTARTPVSACLPPTPLHRCIGLRVRSPNDPHCARDHPRPVQRGGRIGVRQTPYLFAPADDRNTLATPTVGCFNVRSARSSSPSSRKLTSVTICRELRHSAQTIKSEHVGTDRRRKNRLLFTSTPACPSWGRVKIARCQSARPSFSKPDASRRDPLSQCRA